MSTSSSTDQQQQQQKDVIWIPLESDPDIQTEYLRMITLTNHYLIDVPVIDGAEEMGIFEGHNVKAYIFLYQINDNSELENNKELVSVSTEDKVFIKPPFFMKQFSRNACGSVALFHAYINTVPQSAFQPDSVMAKFYAEAANVDYETRGKVFSVSDSIRDMHHSSATQGQSSVPTGAELDNITYHYVPIFWYEGKILLLDGRRPTIMLLGDCPDQSNFRVDALRLIADKLIAQDPNNVFSILAFCGEP